MNDEAPHVLFACVHNAGRSQMAAALMHELGAGSVRVSSAGSDPADTVHASVVEAMAEVGIDVSGELPTRLSNEAVEAADVVVTMGCGDECPFYPGKRYLDWELDDPAALDRDGVRRVRDEITARVQALLAELTAPGPVEFRP